MAPSGGRVALGDVAGDRLGAGPGVAFQGADRGVPGAGQQHRGVGAILGLMGEGAVAQLVQRPPGRLLEQVDGASIGQAAATADRVQIAGRDGTGRCSVGQEHRAAGPAGDQAAQESGGAGLPVDPLYCPALGGHSGALVDEGRGPRG